MVDVKQLSKRTRTYLLRRLPYRPPERGDPIEVPDRPEDAVPLLERLLYKNIIPYWHTHALDHEFGGYVLARDGEDRPTAQKTERWLIVQARMFWYFSRLFSGGFAGEEALEAARHGFEYLRDVMRDKEHGGYFWKIDAVTGKPQMDRKHICGHAYVLFGLCEYAKAAKSDEAAEMAHDLFNLFEEKAYDSEHGGYREFFEPDWQPSNAPEIGYLTNAGPGTKRHATHIHIFEAYLDYYELSGNPLVLKRIEELIEIQTVKVVRPEGPACTDNHTADWTPVVRDHKRAIAYGHDIETAWMVPIGCERLGLPRTALVDASAALFETAYNHAFDTKKGGFFTAGPLTGPAYRRDKQWWVQAEALICALYFYQRTGEPRYADCFLKTLDWIVNMQADWQGGEWHSLIAPNGRIMGVKADRWKAAYHTGRSMMTCLELLKSASAERTG
ncbi:MAG: AGE family epimerase/isomerase [Alphaproteobacteria bacterium]